MPFGVLAMATIMTTSVNKILLGNIMTVLFCGLLVLPIFADEAIGVTSLKELRERGVVMQEWETSCAAASIATVLTYGFGDPVSERFAAEQMLKHTDPAKVRQLGGFSLLDLKRFVVERGYQGSAYRGLSFDDLKIFHAPIVPINANGYNHYVVFNGFDGDQVLLADPSFGNRRLGKERFISIWMNGMAFVTTR